MEKKKVTIKGYGEFEVIPIRCKVGDTVWFDDNGIYLEGVVNKIESDEYWIEDADEDTPEKKHYGRIDIICTTENSHYKGQNFLIYADEIIYEKPKEINNENENVKRIPFSYKDIVDESHKRFPNAIWEANAFRLGVHWAVNKIFSDMTREEIIEEMGIPTITCDDMEIHPKKEIKAKNIVECYNCKRIVEYSDEDVKDNPFVVCPDCKTEICILD